MEILKIFWYFVLCLELSSAANRWYRGPSDDTIYRSDLSNQPLQPPVDTRNPNFYRPTPWISHQSNNAVKSEADSSCVRNFNQRAADEEAERFCKYCKPSGNFWHGAISYPKHVYSFYKQDDRNNNQDNLKQPLQKPFNRLTGVYGAKNMGRLYEPLQGSQSQPGVNYMGDIPTEWQPTERQPFYRLAQVNGPNGIRKPQATRSNNFRDWRN